MRHSRHDWPRIGDASVGLSSSEEELAARRQRARLEQGPLEVGRDRLELLDGRAGRLQVARRERDVDLGGQEAAAGRPVRRRAGPGGGGQGPLDRPSRIADLAARELEEGETGLRVVAEFVGAVERLPGRVEVAHPQPDLADLVLRVPDGVHEPVPLELVAGLAGVLLGFGPVTAEHLELGPMDLADPRIAADGLAPHPALALIGPLGGAPEVADVPTRRDRVAVDVARDAQVEPARGRGRGGLVDQGDAALPASGHDHGDALEAHRHVERVGVVEPARLGHRPVGQLDGRLDPSLHEGLEGLVDPELGTDRRVRQALEDPLRLPHPASADGEGQAAECLVGERGRDRPASSDVRRPRSRRTRARGHRWPRRDVRPTTLRSRAARDRREQGRRPGRRQPATPSPRPTRVGRRRPCRFRWPRSSGAHWLPRSQSSRDRTAIMGARCKRSTVGSTYSSRIRGMRSASGMSTSSSFRRRACAARSLSRGGPNTPVRMNASRS